MTKLVFTQSSGYVYGRLAEIAVPFMQEYAHKVGAEFLYECQELKSKYPLFDKYKTGELLVLYDQILFLDCDILIHPQSPDVFEIAGDDFAAFNEGGICDEAELAARQHYLEMAEEKFSISVPEFNMQTSYFNCGVFVVSGKHQPLFEKPLEGPHLNQLTAEQNLMNLRLVKNGYKTRSLSYQFNAMPFRWTQNYMNENYFVHFAGLKPSIREDMMRDVAKKWIKQRSETCLTVE